MTREEADVGEVVSVVPDEKYRRSW